MSIVPRLLLPTTTALAALAALACGAGEASPSVGGAAYTNLFEALGRPAGLRVQGDSAAIVTFMINKQMRGVNRQVAARAAAHTVARTWPGAHLTHVIVVFRDATRIGPFVLRPQDDSVRIDDATPTVDTVRTPPARLP